MPQIQYRFSHETFEFISSCICQIDPLESIKKGTQVYAVAANCTLIEPPSCTENNIPVWNGSSWDIVEDHRGEEYWPVGASYGTPAETMKDLGPLPDGATTTAPEKHESTAEEIAAQKLAQETSLSARIAALEDALAELAGGAE